MPIYTSSGGAGLLLDPKEKAAVQVLLEDLKAKDKAEVERILNSAAVLDDPAWQRYARGVAGHPRTWWIGIIQVQMVLGIFGPKYKRSAQLRQHSLAQVYGRLLHPKNWDRTLDLLFRAAKFNLKYRKSDVAGRLHGSVFTSYASSGGRVGSQAKVPKMVKAARFPMNFALASHGAAVEALARGLRHDDAIINAIMTGHPERLPVAYRSGPISSEASPDEEALRTITEAKLQTSDQLNKISPQPVSIADFCSRPENVDLTEICAP